MSKGLWSWTNEKKNNNNKINFKASASVSQDLNLWLQWMSSFTRTDVVIPTFARLIVDADGLGLVLATVSLHTDEVGVGALIEARPYGQHVLIGLTQSLH